MIEIGGDAEEGGHQVQGEGNPKKKTPTKQYKRWERGKTAIFLEVPLRGDLRFTLSKLLLY